MVHELKPKRDERFTSLCYKDSMAYLGTDKGKVIVVDIINNTLVKSIPAQFEFLNTQNINQ